MRTGDRLPTTGAGKEPNRCYHDYYVCYHYHYDDGPGHNGSQR